MKKIRNILIIAILGISVYSALLAWTPIEKMYYEWKLGTAIDQVYESYNSFILEHSGESDVTWYIYPLEKYKKTTKNPIRVTVQHTSIEELEQIARTVFKQYDIAVQAPILDDAYFHAEGAMVEDYLNFHVTSDREKPLSIFIRIHSKEIVDIVDVE